MRTEIVIEKKRRDLFNEKNGVIELRFIINDEVRLFIKGKNLRFNSREIKVKK